SPVDTDNPSAGATGAIGDRIWNDADGDGVQDAGEVGIVGVTVKLLTDDDGDGVYDVEFKTTTTGPDGRYIFDTLPPGSYVVAVDTASLNTAGYNTTPTGDPDSILDGKTSSPVVLAPGDVFVNADFGYKADGDNNPATLDNGGHSIGDLIYLDTNASGAYDSAVDTGIPGVSVVLEDSSGNILATAITDETGVYRFDGLPDGAYTVKVADNGNLLDGLSATGFPAGGSAYESSVTLSGSDDLDQDFGYAPVGHGPGEGLIGDTVFLDLNNDGNVNPGEGIEGVTVQLYDSTGTTLLQSTVTNNNGSYAFGNLNSTETYTVKVDTATLPNGGAGLTNNVDPETVVTGNGDSASVVDLSASGGVNLDQNLGYQNTS
ncbi:MAG: hypothetical protein D3914_17445, partial [Candidatus Electrothrix sp. LOE2]|nr:hypothetical protein [Candidatus Electrothrix sp. LOE2]